MQKIILITAILASVAAAPGYYEEPSYTYPVHELSSAKSTLTKSSHLINHGGTSVVHAPLYHVPLVHEVGTAKSTVTKSSQIVNHGSTTVLHPVMTHVPVVESAKSTLTKSSQVVNHGGTAVVHSPLSYPSVYTPVQAVSYAAYSPLVYSSKIGDSAVSHHSSTVHETVPTINHLYYHH